MAKPKECKICHERFLPARNLQTVCGPRCATELGIQRVRRKVLATQRETRVREKQRLKTRAQWLAEAQAAFNRYIRARDHGQPCISCGRDHQGQWHAGHYRTTKACPELRFDESNCHKQCAPCNTHLSGNIVEYRINLVNRIGQGEVDRLEGPQTPVKLSIDDIKAIKETYARKAREEERWLKR